MVTIRCFDRVFNQVEAVVFDKDGTLANSEALLSHLGQCRINLLEAQVPGVKQQLRACFGLHPSVSPTGLLAVGTRQETEIAAAACLAAAGQDWVEALAIAQTAFEQAAQRFNPKASHTPPCAGVVELVLRLFKAGVKLAVLSSDTLDQITSFVQTYELESYFPVQVGAMTGLSKPNPALLLYTCEQLQVVPVRTLVIGDSRADSDMARAAGVACIGVTWGWSQAPNIPTADIVVPNPEAIQVAESS